MRNEKDHEYQHISCRCNTYTAEAMYIDFMSIISSRRGGHSPYRWCHRDEDGPRPY